MKKFEADSRFDVLIADYVKGNDVMANCWSRLDLNVESLMK